MRNWLLRTSGHPRAATIWAVVWLLVAGVMLAQTYRKAYREHGYDLTSRLLSTQAILDGEDPYAVESPFPLNYYPQFLPFALIPLLVLPYWLAVALWFAAGVLGLFLATWLALKLAEPLLGTTVSRESFVLASFLLIPLFDYVHNNFLNGQVNFLVLLFCMLSLRAHLEDKPLRSAWWLALGIATKVVPLVLVPFFVMRRRWTTAAGSVVIAVALCLLPGLVAGGKVFTWYGGYFDRMLADSLSGASGGHEFFFVNVSGFIAWLVPSLSDGGWIKPLSLLLVMGPILALELRGLGRGARLADNWAFHLYLAASLLLSPLTEMHHVAIVMPAIVLLGFKAVYDAPWTTPLRCGLLVAIYLVPLVSKVDKFGPWRFFAVASLFVLLAWSWAAAQREAGPQRVRP